MNLFGKRKPSGSAPSSGGGALTKDAIARLHDAEEQLTKREEHLTRKAAHELAEAKKFSADKNKRGADRERVARRQHLAYPRPRARAPAAASAWPVLGHTPAGALPPSACLNARRARPPAPRSRADCAEKEEAVRSAAREGERFQDDTRAAAHGARAGQHLEGHL